MILFRGLEINLCRTVVSLILIKKVFNEEGSQQRGFVQKSRKLDMGIDFGLATGDCLIIKANVAPLWISFVFRVDPRGKGVRDARISTNTGAETRVEAIEEGEQESGAIGELPKPEDQE